MSERKQIATSRAPAAIGPYSQAIAAAGLVHCSGQIPLDPATGEFVPGGIAEQTEQVLRNLSQVLREAGSSLERVVKCNVYLLRMADFQAMNAVYARHFGGEAPPARATVAVAELPRGALVEIDCLALAG